MFICAKSSYKMPFMRYMKLFKMIVANVKCAMCADAQEGYLIVNAEKFLYVKSASDHNAR